jgi:hypothetical protein
MKDHRLIAEPTLVQQARDNVKRWRETVSPFCKAQMLKPLASGNPAHLRDSFLAQNGPASFWTITAVNRLEPNISSELPLAMQTPRTSSLPAVRRS